MFKAQDDFVGWLKLVLAWFGALSPNQVVLTLTGIYTLLQIILVGFKLRATLAAQRRAKSSVRPEPSESDLIE